MFYCTTYPSLVGNLTLVCDGENLVGLWLEDQRYFKETIPEHMLEKEDLPVFYTAKNWLDRYFAGEKPENSELPLRPIGGSFRQGVWNILCKIPYGEVTSYGHIAKKTAEKLGRETMSSRAVGGAVGHNPISIIIPCHRVVGANGALTGYSGGVAKKVLLLKLEGIAMTQLSASSKKTPSTAMIIAQPPESRQ